MAGFLTQMGVALPVFFAWLVALLDTVGSVLLALGLGVRLLALLFVIDMVMAIWLGRIRAGKAQFAGGGAIGWEFEFILGVGSLALLLLGAGAYSLDVLIGL